MPPARRSPRRSGSELLTRVAVAVPAAVVAVVLIDLGGLAWVLFMVAIGWLALHELYRMLARWRPVAAVGFAALLALVLCAHYVGQRDVLLVAVAAVPAAFAAAVARGHGHATVAIAGTLLGVWWIGMAVAHAVLLRELPHGKGVVIDVLVGTFIGDTGAYLGGRLFGRRPLARRLSPHKTIEGLLCGALCAIVAVVLAALFQPWMTRGHALLLGITVAVLGPAGDLFESMVKRDAGAKDTGAFFGPHGGVLDRADAALFTLVAGYYVWYGVVH